MSRYKACQAMLVRAQEGGVLCHTLTELSEEKNEVDGRFATAPI